MGEGQFLSLRVIYKPKNIQTKNSLIRGHISTTTPWGVGLTSISNKPEVRGGDGKFLSFRESYISNLGLLLSLEASKKFVWWRFQRLYHEVPKIISC